MKRRVALLAWAALTVAMCLRADLWNRGLSTDDRLYFYMSERAASGVPPHVSAPDVKSQLSTLAFGASIAAGRVVGLDDVRSGRLAAMAMLVLGVCGVGLAVTAMGGSLAAAGLGAVSTLAFSALVGHTAIGFNPKVPLFTAIAWTHVLLARRRFGAAGALAAASMLCWQPAGAVGVGAVAAALTAAPRWRNLLRLALGAAVTIALYEAYYAWHGAVAAQLFQTWVLPFGSVREHTKMTTLENGFSFVLFGEQHGLDYYGIPAAAFFVLMAGSLVALLARLGRLLARRGDGDPAPESGTNPALVSLLVGGSLCVAFTSYDHQAEPDRFLLVAYFGIALGLVVDRALRWMGARLGGPAVRRVEGVLATLLLLQTFATPGRTWRHSPSLRSQLEAGRVLRMYAEAYGEVWAFGCAHLLGLAHLTNFHPLAYVWDDLEPLFDAASFTPEVRGRLPDIILVGRRLPGRDLLLRQYVPVPVAGLDGERVRLYVRESARTPGARDEEAFRRGRTGRVTRSKPRRQAQDEQEDSAVE